MAEVVYLNGSLVPRAQARVSAFDQGFLYGYGLFETMRAYHGRIFRLERHLKRLLGSAEVIGIGSGLAEDVLAGACHEVLRANGCQEARVRLTVSRGEADSLAGSGEKISPTILATAVSYTPLPKATYQKGYRAMISSLRRYRASPLSRIKSANYLVSILARKEAAEGGFDEALLLNDQGNLAEGSVSNLFLAGSDGLVTPPRDAGILPGITREVVMELAEGLGLKVTETELKMADLTNFPEAFLTNSIMEIMPLVAVRDRHGKMASVGSGKPGGITVKLMAAYKTMVTRETG